MTEAINTAPVSVIVPTIGRPESLRRLLTSLCDQTVRPSEVIIADGSGSDDSMRLLEEPEWAEAGLRVRRIEVVPPNAVRQRTAAIDASSLECLLLLDDDVELERDCIEQMFNLLCADDATVAVVADFNNQAWSTPTRAWRIYLRFVMGMKEGEWQGRVIGPLLRFGFNPVPSHPVRMEWIGTCNSMVRRNAYERVDGFSGFFLHRCTMNEDVDLGLKLSRIGTILFCPAARMAHYHAPGGRVNVAGVAEDDVYNRYMILRMTLRRARAMAIGLVTIFVLTETVSNLIGAIGRARLGTSRALLVGRLRGLCKAAASAIGCKSPALG